MQYFGNAKIITRKVEVYEILRKKFANIWIFFRRQRYHEKTVRNVEKIRKARLFAHKRN